MVKTAFKIACFMTLIIPIIAFVGKIILRSIYDFAISTPALPPGNAVPTPPMTKINLTSDELDQLFEAVRSQDLPKVQALLKKCIIPPPILGAAISAASQAGHLKIVQEVLKYGVTIRQKESAAFQAVLKGHLDILQELLKDDSISDDYRSFLVYEAGKYGNVEIIQELLSHGVISDFYLQKGMIEAANEGHLDALKALIKYKETAVTDAVLSRLISDAKFFNQTKVVTFLQQFQADRRITK
jgi:hypothetical protein